VEDEKWGEQLAMKKEIQKLHADFLQGLFQSREDRDPQFRKIKCTVR
jgi:hypothetical protein